MAWNHLAAKPLSVFLFTKGEAFGEGGGVVKPIFFKFCQNVSILQLLFVLEFFLCQLKIK